MDHPSSTGGVIGSVTPSTALLNQKLGTSTAPRMLTESEIALLRQSKQEMREAFLALPQDVVRPHDASETHALINRLTLDAEHTYISWSHWVALEEAIDAGATASDFKLGELLFSTIRYALIRDAVFGALRLTQSTDVTSEHVSLCAVSTWLSNEAWVRLLSSSDWPLTHGFTPATALADAARNRTRITNFKRLVPTRVAISTDAGQLADDTLVNDREFLVELQARNFFYLAVGRPDRLQARATLQAAMDLVLELSFDAAAVFTGSNIDVATYKAWAAESARERWAAQRQSAP